MVILKKIKSSPKFLTSVFATGGCGSCATNTAPTVPAYLPDPNTRRVLAGGIAGWFAVHCSVGDFNDIKDQAEWEALIAAGTLRGRLNGCRLQGGKPASTDATQRRGACGTDEVVSKTDTYTISDHENDDELSANALYEYIGCSTEWRFGFITCDYRVYEPSSSASYSSKTDFIEADNNETDSFWQLEVTVKRSPCDSLGMCFVPFLENFGDSLMGN